MQNFDLHPKFECHPQEWRKQNKSRRQMKLEENTHTHTHNCVLCTTDGDVWIGFVHTYRIEDAHKFCSRQNSTSPLFTNKFRIYVSVCHSMTGCSWHSLSYFQTHIKLIHIYMWINYGNISFAWKFPIFFPSFLLSFRIVMLAWKRCSLFGRKNAHNSFLFSSLSFSLVSKTIDIWSEHIELFDWFDLKQSS